MADSSLVTYEYYGPAFAHGGEQPSINIHVVHDVEAPIQVGMARSLIGPNYFGKGGDPGKPVSIHYLVGPDDICQGTPEHIIAWQVGTGNPGTLGTEQLGYASMTRNQWLTQAHDQLVNLAKLMADISRRHPLIQLRWLTDDELVFAWHNKSTPGGHTTHAQMTRVGLGTTHTDPGDGWPADYVMALAQGNTPTPPTPPTEDDMQTYNVIRDKRGIDYAYRPGDAFEIMNPDHYFFLTYGGYITVPHGSAQVVEDNYISFIFEEANRYQSRMANGFGGPPFQ